MTGPNFYNEIDPYAAQWLRNLIAAGHIAPGVVDERSIEDIYPEELHGYTQCHFFAGVGVWSLALRRAGWPDHRPIWTGSCPCQPFSAAGQGNGFDDKRHLWPHFHYLIEQCKPAVVLGEQVASKDADPWIDLVHTDLEALGYAFGAIPFPSAGIGAPHIRDRLYWVANAMRAGSLPGALAGVHRGKRGAGARDGESQRPGAIIGLADANMPGQRSGGRGGLHREGEARAFLALGGELVGLGHPDHARLEGQRGGHQTEGGRVGTIRPATAAGESGGLADADGVGREMEVQHDGSGGAAGGVGQAGFAGVRGAVDGGTAGPTNGYWAAADWLGCRDGKWRPVEPGTFPLANGAAARVGRLRAYGNAINAEAARVFIEAVMESL